MGVGGADLAATFIVHDLIDEYRLYIHPVVIGGGGASSPTACTSTSRSSRAARSRTALCCCGSGRWPWQADPHRRATRRRVDRDVAVVHVDDDLA